MNTDRECERLYVIVSAGVKRDIVDSLLFFVCLFVCLFTFVSWAWLRVLMLSECLSAEKQMCVMCLGGFFCILV